MIESLENRRLLAAGDLDNSFSGDGKLTFSFDQANTSTYASDVKSVDGKIVAAGSFGNTFGVARFNDNGSFDDSFSSDGKATSPIFNFVGADVYLATTIVAGETKILAMGKTDLGITVVRFNSNGSLDTVFGGGDGIANIPNFSGYNIVGNAISVDSQGRIVVAGSAGDGFQNRFLVARFTDKGVRDAAFNGNGVEFGPGLNGRIQIAFGVTLDSQDRVVAVGFAEPVGSFNLEQIQVTRYNANGTRDLTFGNGGDVLLDNLPDGEAVVEARGVAIDSDGKIIVAALSPLGFRLARLDSNGVLDSSFGVAGNGNGHGNGDDNGKGNVRYRAYDVPSTNAKDQRAFAMQLDAQGRIVVAGDVMKPFNINNARFALSRFNADGSLDTAFHEGTLVETEMAMGLFDGATALAIDQNGKIILAGQADRNPSGSNAAIVRYEGDPVVTYDYGDAPTSINGLPTNYGTLTTRHQAIGPTLGTVRDTEFTGQPIEGAYGDDFTGVDDEDGVSFSTIVPGLMSTASVSINGIVGNTPAYLSGWIDFNRDGDFDDANEKIIGGATGLAITSDGAYAFTFLVPDSVTLNQTLYARFRLSTQASLATTGEAPDGEVEDYVLYTEPGNDYGDAPAFLLNGDPTSYGTSTAGHRAIGPTLGAVRDAEHSGQPSVNADGDDLIGLINDEDGVRQGVSNDPFSTIDLASGFAIFTVDVIVPPGIFGPAFTYLNAWIDWGGDGVFDDGGPLGIGDNDRLTLSPSFFTQDGQQTFTVPIPAFAKTGLTYARFRISSDFSGDPTTFLQDGEIEDYAVNIIDSGVPHAVRDTATMAEISAGETGSVKVDVLANDMVHPGAGVKATLISFTQPANGTVTRDDNGTPANNSDDQLVYVPNFEFNGIDTFTYVMNDTIGTGANSTGTVSVTVTNVNDAPTAGNDSATGTEDTPVIISIATLLANDSPGLGESTTQTLMVSAGNSSSGSVQVVGSNIIFTPAAELNGTLTFEYVVTDSGTPALTATAIVTVNLAAVNDAPIAGADIAAVLKGFPLQIPVADLLVNDAAGPVNESDQTLQIIAVSNAVNGTVTLSDRGIITFTPAPTFFGAASFQYTVQDSGPTGGANVNVGIGTVNVDVIDGVDLIGPDAILLKPIDNDALGIDQDRSVSVVQLSSSDPEFRYREFRIQLLDPVLGSGVDDNTVTNSIIPGLRLTGASVVLFENGRTLQEGIDYTFDYNAGRHEIILTPLAGIWKNYQVYEVAVNNKSRFVLAAPAGDRVTDGDFFTITDVDGGVGSYEFDSGYRLQVPQSLNLLIPLAGGATGGIADGDRFTINDRTRTVTFEFDSDDQFDAGNIRIQFSKRRSQASMSAAVISAINSTSLAVTSRLLSAGKVQISAEAAVTVNSGFSALTQPSNTQAFKIHDLGPRPGGITDGQQFVVSDGYRTVTFEFDNNSAVTAGNTPIDVSSASTVADLTALTQAGLANSILNIHPQVVGTDHVYLGLSPNGSASVGTSRLALTGIARTLSDGQVFTIQGNGLTRTFEFTRDLTVTPGNIALQVNLTDTEDEIGTRLASAITDAGLGLNPTYVGNGNIAVGGTDNHSIDTTGTPSLGLVGNPGVQSHTRLQVFGPLMLQVPPRGAADINDNATFRITNNNRTKLFEFDGNFSGPSLPGNVVIRYDGNDTAADIAAVIASAISASGLGIDPINLGNGILSLGPLQASQVQVLASNLTTSRGVMNDGETFTINNGTQLVTFEFENVTVGDGFAVGNVPILFSSSSTPDSVVQSMKTVIEGSSLGLTTTVLPNGILELNDTPRYQIDLRGAPTLIKSGVPGGANAVFFIEDANFDRTEMMRAMVDAINSSSDTRLTALSRTGDTLFVENAISVSPEIDSYFLRGVADLAGNLLKPNRINTETQFTIVMPKVQNDILLSVNTVAENAINGTVVGTLSGAVPDVGDSLTYSIVDGAGGRFVVQGNLLKVADGSKLNFKTQASHSITVQVRDANGLGLTFNKTFTIQILKPLELLAFDVQEGDLQRSYIRYVDWVFSSVPEEGPLRFQLMRTDLNGSNLSEVSLPSPNFTGAAYTFDFGSQGIGGNRNSDLGDGYYQFKFDLDGDGTFETTRSFFRLFGDTDGNGVVNSDDLNAIDAAKKAGASPTAKRNADINGDGVVNALDRLYGTRALNRRLLNGVLVDD